MTSDPPIKLHGQRDGAVYIDPLYGHIPIPAPLLKLIDLPSFQRLRGLKQLATIYLTLAGANHTRFEHSIGTFFLATRAFETLQAKIITWPQKHRLYGESDAPPLPGPDHQLAVQIAALLHDIGHGPFCHVFDMFLGLPTTGGPASHDHVTKEIILGKIPGFEDVSEYLEILHAEQGGPSILLKENIASLAVGETPMYEMDGTEYRYLAEIVSSSWGVDRLDYLRRDSYHTGIETGRLDIWTIIDSYTLRRAVASDSSGHILKGENGEEYDAWNLGVEMRAAPWLEAMLDTRDQCYQLLYFSKSNRIAVSMLVRAMERAYSDLRKNADVDDVKNLWRKLWRMTDAELLAWLQTSDEIHDPLPRAIAKRIQERQLYEALPVEIVSSGSLEKDDAHGIDETQALHKLIVELPFKEKDITRLRKFKQKGIGTLLEIEQDTARELPDIPDSETIVFDVYTPPFEPVSTFTSPVLEDLQRNRFYSLVQVLPHLHATKTPRKLPGGSISPYELHARYLRRIRIYVPPRMLVSAVSRVFLHASGKLSAEDELLFCLTQLEPAMEKISDKFAAAVGLEQDDGQELFSSLMSNTEVDLRTLLQSLPFRIYIAQTMTEECSDYSLAEKKRIKRMIQELVRVRKEEKKLREAIRQLAEIASGRGGALLKALRALIVDFMSETAVKLLKGA